MMEKIILSHESIDQFNWFIEIKTRFRVVIQLLTNKEFIYIGISKTPNNNMELDIHTYKMNDKGIVKVLGALKEIHEERINYGKSVDRQLKEILNGNS